MYQSKKKRIFHITFECVELLTIRDEINSVEILSIKLLTTEKNLQKKVKQILEQALTEIGERLAKSD